MYRCIQEYCAAFGQMVNVDKSSIIFSTNTPEEVRREIGNVLRVKVAMNPGIYLGIPSMWGKLSVRLLVM